ncbi:hypothetical protein ACFX10_038391 [Malus domestica]
MDNHLEGQVCSHRPLSVSGTTTMLLLPIFASAVRIVNFGTEPISITTGASSSQTFKNTMPPFRASSTPSSSSSIIGGPALAVGSGFGTTTSQPNPFESCTYIFSCIKFYNNVYAIQLIKFCDFLYFNQSFLHYHKPHLRLSLVRQAYNHFLLRLNQTSSFTNLVTMSLLVVFLPLHYLSHSVTLLLALVWGSPLLLVLQAA